MDLGLPDMDGTEVIKQIRKASDTPIIVLSARSNEADKVEALDLGANDYITKPFGTDELLARVRATLRTARFQGAGSGIRQEFKLGDMKISYDARRVTIGEEEIRLTQTEYNIVELLCRTCRKSPYLCGNHKKSVGVFGLRQCQKTSGKYGKYS